MRSNHNYKKYRRKNASNCAMADCPIPGIINFE